MTDRNIRNHGICENNPSKTIWRKKLNRTRHLPLWRVVTWTPQTELWPGRTHSPLVWCTGYSRRRWRRTAGALPRSRKPLNQRHTSLQRMNTSWLNTQKNTWANNTPGHLVTLLIGSVPNTHYLSSHIHSFSRRWLTNEGSNKELHLEEAIPKFQTLKTFISKILFFILNINNYNPDYKKRKKKKMLEHLIWIIDINAHINILNIKILNC